MEGLGRVALSSYIYIPSIKSLLPFHKKNPTKREKREKKIEIEYESVRGGQILEISEINQERRSIRRIQARRIHQGGNSPGAN